MERTAKEALTTDAISFSGAFTTWMFWLAMFLLLAATMFTCSLILGFRAGTGLLHPNPFVAYESLWPGQAIVNPAEIVRRTIPGSPLTCVNKLYPSVPMGESAQSSQWTKNAILCTGTPKDSVFNCLSLTIENGQVQSLHLTSNRLQQDALFLYWGAPDVIRDTGSQERWSLQWNRSSYQATALVREATSVVEDVSVRVKE